MQSLKTVILSELELTSASHFPITNARQVPKPHSKLSKGAVAAIVCIPTALLLICLVRWWYNRERRAAYAPMAGGGTAYGAAP